MCGIVGYTGFRDAYDVVINGLRRLEYRGYDSAGVILELQNGDFEFKKTKGKVDDLVAISKNLQTTSKLGMGHTRWATHGVPSDNNSHPHLSNNGKIAIVHNGIIENYDTIKTMLINKNFEFKSETDTEVLVNLSEGEGVSLISGAKRGFFDKIKNVFSSGNDFADNTVLELRPQGEISAFSKKMNESFNTDATAMLESKIAQERTFELDVTNGLINKQRFDPRRVDVSAKVGTVERWIINSSLPVGFTIQGAKFVIESQDDVNVDVSELAWKDTVWVKKKVQILVKFEQPSSNTHPFLFGSSNLMLADMGCLGIMIVQ